MGLFKQDIFGKNLFLKKTLFQMVGLFSHRRYRGFNELKIEGSEIIRDLPHNNVLFVSNHQTYFADVVAMIHVFNASLRLYLNKPNATKSIDKNAKFPGG